MVVTDVWNWPEEYGIDEVPCMEALQISSFGAGRICTDTLYSESVLTVGPG